MREKRKEAMVVGPSHLREGSGEGLASSLRPRVLVTFVGHLRSMSISEGTAHPAGPRPTICTHKFRAAQSHTLFDTMKRVVDGEGSVSV